MKVEVLVAALNKNAKELIKKMNIQTDAIIANQCNENKIEEILTNDHTIKILNFNEKGVGLNRNNALIRSKGDICILADDDMHFCNNYEIVVQRIFRENPSADIIVFNLYNDRNKIRRRKFKVGRFNYMKYGASRIAFRRKSISYAGISFNQNFGGGTQHSCGEDTIFLHDCLEKKLKIMRVDECIAALDENSESTWFKGYNKKFFYDRGVLHATLYKRKIKFRCLIYLFNLIFIIRHRKIICNNINIKESLKYMNYGVRKLFKV